MQSFKPNSLIKSCLVIIITYLSFPIAYPQTTKELKEIDEAVHNALNAKYEQAIPVLKKYEKKIKRFNDYNIFRIIGYLNWCYLATNNDAMEFIQFNSLADDYISKYGISQTDFLRADDETTLLDIASLINSYIGNYAKVVFYLSLIKNYYEQNHLSHDRFYSSVLRKLARGYYNLSDFKLAIEIGQKALVVNSELFGEKNNETLEILYLLYTSFLEINKIEKSLEYLEKFKVIGLEILGEKHPDYLECLSYLVVIKSELGEYQQALEINLKVAELRKEALGEEHPDYLLSLNNLASIYSDLGEYLKALEINLKVAELRKEALGEEHPDYLTSLSNLALSYSDIGDYQKGLELNLKVAELRKVVLGENHPDYLGSLNNLASSYSLLGDYQKGLEIFLKIADIQKETLGDKHPDYLLTLGNLSYSEFYLLKFQSALSRYLQILNYIQNLIVEYFRVMTEHEREMYLSIKNHLFTLFPIYFEKANDSYSEAANDFYNIALFTKGLLLNTTIDFEKLIAESGNTDAIEKFEELKLLKLQILWIQEKPIAERYLNVDSLENIAQQKETELVKLSKEYGDYTQNLKITWQDVQANLLVNDVAIEFVEYPTLSDTVKYAALVLRKDWQYPKMIPLFCKDHIEEFIIQDEDKIYSYGYVGKQMKKLLWEPLEEFISSGERVYFSPAGIIHQLAIENFAWDDSTILSERYQMHRLSSTKELVVQQSESKSHLAVVYGGLYFKLDSVDMIAGSKKFDTPDDLFALVRGYPNDYSERSGWDTIYGTRLEAEQINLLLSDKKYQVDLYTGKAGIEESFKALSGKKNGIIHIATHGFFLPIEESRQNPFVMQRIGDDQPAKTTIDPMLRSGLIMAGGNKAWLGEDIPDNIEDGVLTAKEISHVDLRGTDMVVLSACETGLGEVSSEGVFGLQRSFKQAGVKTIVMSLWKVNDEATKYMMTEFYASLLSGKEKREAFLEAKQKCREKYIDPRYWAAFIMLN